MVEITRYDSGGSANSVGLCLRALTPTGSIYGENCKACPLL